MQVYTTDTLVRVEEHNEWRVLVRIPAGDLKPNNVYAFVFMGIMGGFQSATTGLPRNVAEVTMRIGAGSYFQAHHRMDLANPYLINMGGHPFLRVLVTQTPSVLEDYAMVGRCDAQYTFHPVPSFLVDCPTVHVWDLTGLQSGVGYQHYGSSTPVTLSDTPQRLLGVGAPLSSHQWLIYHSVELDHGGGGYMPATWLAKTASPTNHFHALRPLPGFGQSGSHIGCLHRATNVNRLGQNFHKLCLGEFALVDTAATPLADLSLYARDYLATGGGARPRVTRSDLLMVRLTGHASEVAGVYLDHPAGPAINDPVYGELGNSDSVVRALSTTTPIQATCLTANRVAQRVSASSQRAQLRYAQATYEIDGSRWVPRHLNPLWIATLDLLEALPQFRSVETLFDGGTHCHRLIGQRHTLLDDESRPEAWDLYFMHWFNRANWTAPLPVLDTPGPFVEIVPGREALGAGDLDALPFEPSTVQLDDLAQMAEHRSSGGYRTTWPRPLGVRGIYSLTWLLTESDAEVLELFLRGLRDKGGAFKWAPRDRPNAETVFLLDISGADAWRIAPVAGGNAEVTARALELVYVG